MSQWDWVHVDRIWEMARYMPQKDTTDVCGGEDINLPTHTHHWLRLVPWSITLLSSVPASMDRHHSWPHVPIWHGSLASAGDSPSQISINQVPEVSGGISPNPVKEVWVIAVVFTESDASGMGSYIIDCTGILRQYRCSSIIVKSWRTNFNQNDPHLFFRSIFQEWHLF